MWRLLGQLPAPNPVPSLFRRFTDAPSVLEERFGYMSDNRGTLFGGSVED